MALNWTPDILCFSLYLLKKRSFETFFCASVWMLCSWNHFCQWLFFSICHDVTMALGKLFACWAFQSPSNAWNKTDNWKELTKRHLECRAETKQRKEEEVWIFSPMIIIVWDGMDDLGASTSPQGFQTLLTDKDCRQRRWTVVFGFLPMLSTITDHVLPANTLWDIIS